MLPNIYLHKLNNKNPYINDATARPCSLHMILNYYSNTYVMNPIYRIFFISALLQVITKMVDGVWNIVRVPLWNIAPMFLTHESFTNALTQNMNCSPHALAMRYSIYHNDTAFPIHNARTIWRFNGYI